MATAAVPLLTAAVAPDQAPLVEAAIASSCAPPVALIVAPYRPETVWLVGWYNLQAGAASVRLQISFGSPSLYETVTVVLPALNFWMVKLEFQPLKLFIRLGTYRGLPPLEAPSKELVAPVDGLFWLFTATTFWLAVTTAEPSHDVLALNPVGVTFFSAHV